MLGKLFVFVCLATYAGAVDIAAWQEFFEHCTLPANGGFVDDDGFCTDFKKEKSEEFATIQAQDNKYLDTIDNEADLEAVSEDPNDFESSTSTSSSSSSTPVALEEKGLARMMKKGHKHHHKHKHGHRRFAQSRDPINNSIWPNGNVYYAIATKADAANDVKALNVEMYERVLEALKQWEAATCIDFIAASEDDASNGLVVFGDSTSDKCSARPGYIAATKRRIQLQAPGGTNWKDGCPMWTVVHELGHALGEKHTQGRQDRDKYVTVVDTTDAQYDKADTATTTDEPLMGTSETDKAEEFYDSFMLYSVKKPAKMVIATGWATPGPDGNLTAVDAGLRDGWKQSAGQRKHMGALDARTVNSKYQCFQPNVRDLGSANPPTKLSWIHNKQSLGQYIDKLALYLHKDPTAVSLYTDEQKTGEYTSQPRTTLMDSLNPVVTASSNLTVEISTTKVTFEFGGHSILGFRFWLDEKHVFFKSADTLNKLIDNVKYHVGQDFSSKDVSKGSATLDKTKTLADLGVVDGDTLTVAA